MVGEWSRVEWWERARGEGRDGDGGTGGEEAASADRDEGAPGVWKDVGVARHSQGAAMPGGG